MSLLFYGIYLIIISLTVSVYYMYYLQRATTLINMVFIAHNTIPISQSINLSPLILR